MADKPKKPQKLRARLPRGLADRGPAEIAATRRMVATIREVYERYGFEPVETPAMEFTDALGKFLPDQDRPNEGVFSFQDDDEQWISLRYDLTAPLARYVAENYGTDRIVLPYRSYREGYVYRNEKPGPGRFRQFMQFDADTVGSASPAADAEMCMMAADAMEALGIPRGSYVVKVNNRKVLDGVMERIGLGGDENAGRRLTVLRAIDKLDKFSTDDVRKLLGPGRWDGGEEGKGDFTKGAHLDDEQTNIIMMQFAQPPVTPLVDGPSRVESRIHSDSDAAVPTSDVPARSYPVHQAYIDGTMELVEIQRLVLASGYESDRIKIDPSVVRGLEYYTGAVYEVELLLETKDDKGRPVRFGSVGGGGRYDGLVSRFRGEPVPATGFSIGVSRLQAALEHLNKDKPKTVTYGPVVVTVFGGDIADYQRFVKMLRDAPLDEAKPDGPKIHAELYLGNPKHSLSQQVKYADRRNSVCVVTQGSDEKAAGTVQVNDLIRGANLTSISDREEYLRRKNESLETVAEGDLVTKVREVLSRHNVTWS